MLADEVCTYLAAAGLGLTQGTNLFTAPFPDGAPDTGACLIDTPGEKGEDVFGGSLSPEAVELPHFQVLVRAKDPAAARQLAWNVMKMLRNFQGTLSGVRYLRIERVSALPFFLKSDENHRYYYVGNYRAWKEESA